MKLDLFKLLVNNQSNDIAMTSQNLQDVIDELCGAITDRDRKYILQKTFATFGFNTNDPLTETKFVEVKSNFHTINLLFRRCLRFIISPKICL